MKLLKYDSNWADEMDIDGFTIMSDEGWESWKTDIQKFFKKREYWNYGIGTNEDIEYGSAKEVLKDIKVIDISEDEADIIDKLFFKDSVYKTFGYFPCFYDYIEDGDED